MNGDAFSEHRNKRFRKQLQYLEILWQLRLKIRITLLMKNDILLLDYHSSKD